MTINIDHLQPIVSLIAGIAILIVPRLLNYIVAAFLIQQRLGLGGSSIGQDGAMRALIGTGGGRFVLHSHVGSPLRRSSRVDVRIGNV